MRVPSCSFNSLSLKIPSKKMDFSFPQLKFSNKGRKEDFKNYSFNSFPFHFLTLSVVVTIVKSTIGYSLSSAPWA